MVPANRDGVAWRSDSPQKRRLKIPQVCRRAFPGARPGRSGGAPIADDSNDPSRSAGGAAR
jgi:hypothetical protein